MTPDGIQDSSANDSVEWSQDKARYDLRVGLALRPGGGGGRCVIEAGL